MPHMEDVVMGKPQPFGGFINGNKIQGVGENLLPGFLVGSRAVQDGIHCTDKGLAAGFAQIALPAALRPILHKMAATVWARIDMAIVYGILRAFRKAIDRLVNEKEPFLGHLFDLAD